MRYCATNLEHARSKHNTTCRSLMWRHMRRILTHFYDGAGVQEGRQGQQRPAVSRGILCCAEGGRARGSEKIIILFWTNYESNICMSPREISVINLVPCMHMSTQKIHVVIPINDFVCWLRAKKQVSRRSSKKHSQIMTATHPVRSWLIFPTVYLVCLVYLSHIRRSRPCVSASVSVCLCVHVCVCLACVRACVLKLCYKIIF